MQAFSAKREISVAFRSAKDCDDAAFAERKASIKRRMMLSFCAVLLLMSNSTLADLGYKPSRPEHYLNGSNDSSMGFGSDGLQEPETADESQDSSTWTPVIAGAFLSIAVLAGVAIKRRLGRACLPRNHRRHGLD